MAGPAPKETQEIPVDIPVKESSGKIITFPTSPERIHHEAASKITTNLAVAGHPTSIENVKGGQVVNLPPAAKKLGMEPSGFEMSSNDAIRVIAEEFKPETERGMGMVKDANPVQIKIGRQHRQNKMRSLLNRLGFKQAA